MGIGNRIKEARLNLGYTQEDLAKLLGVTKGAVANYEIETSHPKEPIMYKLIEVLNVDANYLFQDCVKLPKETNDVTLAEYNYIKKYRFISKHSPSGINVVDTVLDREYYIAEKLKEQSEQIQKMDVDVSEGHVPTRIIAYYQRLASAGSGNYLFDDIPTDFIEVEETEISRNADFAIGIDGKSMEPDFLDGEKVFVKKVTDLPVGEVGIFINEIGCFIKELGKDRLISRNKAHPDVIPDKNTRLVGKVIGKVNEIKKYI